MDIEEIFSLIKDCHSDGDPNTLDGVINICDNICSVLNDCKAENNWWTEDAMLCIADAAYRAGQEN